MGARETDRSVARLLKWLTILAIAVGVFSTLLYSSGAHIAIRYLNPAFGAWWNTNEFDIMELSACMLGLLIAIRSGARLVEAGQARGRAKFVALVLSLILVAPLAKLVAPLARFGWGGESASIRGSLEAMAGYGFGNILDKILIGGVYFLKGVGFAILAGLALYSLVTGLLMSTETSKPIPDRREETIQ